MLSKQEKDRLIWKSEYNIGDFKVDNEHQSLFVLAKKALYTRDILDDSKAKIELKEIIHSLHKYVAIHFKNEEIYMRSILYPEYERHKQIHKDMLHTLHVFVKSLNTLTLDQIELQLFDFIKDYFITHITKEDIHIGIWKQPIHKLTKQRSFQTAYAMNDEHLDHQHKQLFDIASKAFIPSDDEHREEKIKTIFTQLYRFMKQHFIDEENYMLKINYPFIADHVIHHQKILHDCNELLQKVNDMNEILFEKELAVFIDRGIIDHIIDEDHKIALWYKHNGDPKADEQAACEQLWLEN
jgi:hemerythrin